ncbi:hypothetical protein [Streptomyces sp. NPDC058157]|uniref:hypothetical protein n=1 Tax=Streptomyces sp. NPDC058157 TaxID=3346360 RepID=UPI0036DFEEA7
MQQVTQEARNTAGRNRRKKVVVAGAVLLGLGLTAAGGYATLTSDAWVTSGPFSSQKRAETVDLFANGEKSSVLKRLTGKDMKAGDTTPAEKVELSNKGNVDIGKVLLNAGIPDTPDARELAQVLDIEIAVGHAGPGGTIPKHIVRKRLAELVKDGLDLTSLGLNKLEAGEKVTDRILLKAVMSDRYSEQDAGKRLEQVRFKFTGTDTAPLGNGAAGHEK